MVTDSFGPVMDVLRHRKRGDVKCPRKNDPPISLKISRMTPPRDETKRRHDEPNAGHSSSTDRAIGVPITPSFRTYIAEALFMPTKAQIRKLGNISRSRGIKFALMSFQQHAPQTDRPTDRPTYRGFSSRSYREASLHFNRGSYESLHS